jgi:signal transduction histidine kinase
MTQKAARVHNVHVILVSAVGLVLLVSVALTWLGRRLMDQEESLQKQQAASRLSQGADELVAGFFRQMSEKDAWLGQIGSKLPAPAEISKRGEGAVLVSFSRSGIEVFPAGTLPYYPATPVPELFDAQLFDEAATLEFRANDFAGAATRLMALTENSSPSVRAEALLRLARVEHKGGQVSASLTTYDKLRDEKRLTSLRTPYGVEARLKRSQILAESNQMLQSHKEASELMASIESGAWIIGSDTYADLDTRARELAGLPGQSQLPSDKLALAETVETAWNNWQTFQDPRNSSRSQTDHIFRTEPAPVVALVNANPERMVASVYVGDAIRHLGLDDSSLEKAQLSAVLTDEHGRVLWGKGLESGRNQARRSLGPVRLPWELQVSDLSPSVAFSTQRRNYLIVALVAIVLLVALACYAMARGVLRETAAGQLQSDFVSAVSHEFRSPLTSLRQLTELLAEGRIHDESRRRRYFSVLQQETERLHQLVEDLLDFGRMDAGRRQYRLEPLDFSELVRDGIEEYQNHATANGHHIEVTSESHKLLVEADREALRRVVRNLLENAVKYSPDATTVWVETDCEDRTAVLRIRDEGIGIPPEEKSRIFEKFVRGEAAKQACIPGTGIGLAMVKEIVRVHKGEIDLSSEVGHGTTFMVRLPLSSAAHGSLS